LRENDEVDSAVVVLEVGHSTKGKEEDYTGSSREVDEFSTKKPG
jgi:hypothetical protein